MLYHMGAGGTPKIEDRQPCRIFDITPKTSQPHFLHTLSKTHTHISCLFTTIPSGSTTRCPWEDQRRRPHRKLSGNIKDHVNPASWSGNTNPATVNLGVQWNVGAALAGQALTADGVYTAEEVNYAQIATTSDATMLQPLGTAGGRPGVSPAINRRTQ